MHEEPKTQTVKKGIWLLFVPYLQRGCHCNPGGVISPVFLTGIVSPRVHHSVLLSGFISNSGRYTQKHLRLFKVGGHRQRQQQKPKAREKYPRGWLAKVRIDFLKGPVKWFLLPMLAPDAAFFLYHKNVIHIGSR